VEVLRAAVGLVVRAMVLGAQAAGQQRLLRVERAVTAGEVAGELARLRDENRRLRSENQLLKARLGDLPSRKRYTPMQRLRIMWHVAYYGIPRSRVAEHFLIAHCTSYRWLHAAERGDLGERKGRIDSPRKTPAELARLIWEVFEANPHFGRHRIANVLYRIRRAMHPAGSPVSRGPRRCELSRHRQALVPRSQDDQRAPHMGSRPVCPVLTSPLHPVAPR
jgi:transposase-like protein